MFYLYKKEKENTWTYHTKNNKQSLGLLVKLLQNLACILDYLHDCEAWSNGSNIGSSCLSPFFFLQNSSLCWWHLLFWSFDFRKNHFGLIMCPRCSYHTTYGSTRTNRTGPGSALPSWTEKVKLTWTLFYQTKSTTFQSSNNIFKTNELLLWCKLSHMLHWEWENNLVKDKGRIKFILIRQWHQMDYLDNWYTKYLFIGNEIPQVHNANGYKRDAENIISRLVLDAMKDFICHKDESNTKLSNMDVSLLINNMISWN